MIVDLFCALRSEFYEMKHAKEMKRIWHYDAENNIQMFFGLVSTSGSPEQARQIMKLSNFSEHLMQEFHEIDYKQAS